MESSTQKTDTASPESELVRLRAENAALKESEQFLRLSQRIARVGSWIWEFDANQVRFSEEMFTIFGIRPEGFAGTPDSVVALFHPDDRERATEAVRAAAEEGKSASCEYRVLRPDGTERVVWAEGDVIRDAEGEPVRMVGTMLDVTEQKRAEEALRSSEQRLLLALSAARMGTWEWDASGRVALSDGLLGIFGVSKDSFDGTLDAAMQLIHPDDRASVDEVVTQAMEDPAVSDHFETEYRMIRPDGEIRWIHGKGRVFRDENGVPVSMAGVAVDISNRRRLERELLQSQKMESIGRLAGGIAHDFNNLLTAILGSIELAENRLSPGSDIREHLSTIEEAVQRAGRLTSQLLSFARRQRIELRVFDLNSLVLDMHRLLERVLGQNIELVSLPDDDLWNVKADPVQIEQVLVNLAINARDAMPEGGTLLVKTANVRILEGARTDYGPRSGDHVLLTVSDTGEGMDDEVRSKVFEPFYTTKGAGSGLGLASSYGIIEQVGGSIVVESSRGKGTTFHVYLPREHDSAESRGEAPTRTIPNGTETILVVEDEPMLRRLIVRKLESHGFTVLEAADGVEAKRTSDAYEGEVDALITDVVMPRMDGIELTRKLTESRPGIGVLLISGHSEGAPMDLGTLPAKTAFLPKPFTLNDCLLRLGEVIHAS